MIILFVDITSFLLPRKSIDNEYLTYYKAPPCSCKAPLGFPAHEAVFNFF